MNPNGLKQGCCPRNEFRSKYETGNAEEDEDQEDYGRPKERVWIKK